MNAALTAALIEEDEELLAQLIHAEMEKEVEEQIPIPAVTFSLQSTPEAICWYRFSLERQQVQDIHGFLKLPALIRTAQGVNVPSLIKATIVSLPVEDMIGMFGRSVGVLCSAFLVTAGIIYDKVKVKMEFDVEMIDQCKVECTRCVHEKSGTLDSCIGFIDGTRAICRPTYHQRQAYNGHKRKHALKYQSVIAAPFSSSSLELLPTTSPPPPEESLSETLSTSSDSRHLLYRSLGSSRVIALGGWYPACFTRGMRNGRIARQLQSPLNPIGLGDRYNKDMCSEIYNARNLFALNVAAYNGFLVLHYINDTVGLGGSLILVIL